MRLMIRSKRRSLALEVCPDGSLIVRAPNSLKDSAIHAFLREKRAWIEKTSQAVKERARFFSPKHFIEGESFLYLGREYSLHITEDMFGKLLFEDRFILAAKHQPKARRHFERWYKEEAFSVFTERCHFYAGVMGVSYRSLSLSSAKSRWGCCTPHGTLRLNWKLIMAPLEIIDYVVVHELAHLKELNHSSRFWTLVQQACPQYTSTKKWLKENSLRLQL